MKKILLLCSLLPGMLALTGCTISAEQARCNQLFEQHTLLNPSVFVGIGVGKTQQAAMDQANTRLAAQLRTDVTSQSLISQSYQGQTGSLQFVQRHHISVNEDLLGTKYELYQCSSEQYLVRATKDMRPLLARHPQLLRGSAWTDRVTLMAVRDDGHISAFVHSDQHQETLVNTELFELMSQNGPLTINQKTTAFTRQEHPITIKGKSSAPFASVFYYNGKGQLQSVLLDSPEGDISYTIETLNKPYQPIEAQQFILVQHDTPLQRYFSEPETNLSYTHRRQELVNLVALVKRNHWQVATAIYHPM
ncbi:hypothetical protein [Vibrio sp. WXL210]|uniref:hypothetical protein n=1 Tax=Vibrio sp. WXL210 TaxID=3450709 RepID=UPI003EC64EF0